MEIDNAKKEFVLFVIAILLTLTSSIMPDMGDRAGVLAFSAGTALIAAMPAVGRILPD
jgi:hypothetical protein